MAKKKATVPAADRPDVATPPPAMVIETVPIDSLTSDPRNARLHSEKNLLAIQRSLEKFGQQKVIVVDADGVVLAGNGTLAAAKALRWTHLTISRSQLKGPAARAFALADNRTAELAEWDQDELNRTLTELEEAEIDVGDVGFSDDELAALADEDFETAHAFAPKRVKEESQSPAAEQSIKPQFKVIITCANEAEQADVIRWCEKQALNFKAPSV